MSHIPFPLPGFEVQQVSSVESTLIMTAVATSEGALCPACGQSSRRMHSSYVRSPRDLPISGQAVQLKLRVRRFRCQNPQCARQTFAERLPESVAVSAQQTRRLTQLLKTFAIALNAEGASRLLVHLAMPTSGDTLLRLVKRSPLPPVVAPQVARLQRQARYEEVVEHYRQGQSIAAIARELHMSPTTVRKFVSAGAFASTICPQTETKLSSDPLPALSATTGGARV